ncbi:hypothetical protein [cf. Phormidesmis sp. LEGE 11477]|uniref:hypothetical protein n=1 Tax=cf. Phormidesmis sp. LEGE 11477 TaxID=1828680 RepID=UPI001880BA87|nr:hypothetical protein [cf. Phormidesmis sp. LEGE 11477]MBE9064770.1 hypothetical protein [cf. Phormidesmis sp. LEGE 11477]
MTYLYHLVPKNLTGSVLYPLNTLKQKFPSQYAEHAKKYAGREILTRQLIPPLDCLWNDVLHFSPVHPTLIRAGLLTAGFELRPMQWFEADPIALAFNPNNTTIYLHPPKDRLDFTKMADDFQPFDYELLEDFSGLPAATLAYYRESKEENRFPLLFHRVPHVLYRGSLSIQSLRVIRA